MTASSRAQGPPPAGRSVAETIVVAGMHRSGTSVLTSFLARSGVDMGSMLLPPDPHNPRGYFEDERFVGWHRRLFARRFEGASGGHPDWGWDGDHAVEPGDVERRELDEAAELIAERRAESKGPWGFKDPRATLLLEHWLEVVPDAVFLLLYREPWEVAASMERLGADVFLDHPHYAYDLWSLYNRRLLGFFRRHRERCLLVHSGAAIHHPATAGRLFRDRLGIAPPADGLDSMVDPGRYRTRPPGDPLARSVERALPEVAGLFGELEAAADLTSSDDRSGAVAPAVSPGAPAELRLTVLVDGHGPAPQVLETVSSVERAAPRGVEMILVSGTRSGEPAGGGRAATGACDSTPARRVAAAERWATSSTGAALMLLSCRQRLLPGFVEPALEVLETSPEVGLVSGSRLEVGRRTGLRHPPDPDLDRLLAEDGLRGAFLVRRRAWVEVGGLDPEAGEWCRWELAIRLAREGWGLRRIETPAVEEVIAGSDLLGTVPEAIWRHLIERHREAYLDRLPQVLESLRRRPATPEGQPEQQLAAAVAEREARLHGLADRLRRKEEELDRLTSSRSWRWLSALRGLLG